MITIFFFFQSPFLQSLDAVSMSTDLNGNQLTVVWIHYCWIQIHNRWLCCLLVPFLEFTLLNFNGLNSTLPCCTPYVLPIFAGRVRTQVSFLNCFQENWVKSSYDYIYERASLLINTYYVLDQWRWLLTEFPQYISEMLQGQFSLRRPSHFPLQWQLSLYTTTIAT